MLTIIDKIRAELIRNADEKTRRQGEKFFKEEVKIYGLRSAQVTQISRDYYKTLTDKSKTSIFSLCEDLWKSGFMEEAGIACIWSYNAKKQYVPDDFGIFERWVTNYVSNWAACDTLCNHTVGAFKASMPRTSLRYAIEKMPRELKIIAMAK